MRKAAPAIGIFSPNGSSAKKGRVTALETVSVDWIEEDGRPVRFTEVPGSEKIWPADLVLLALGFVGPEPGTVVAQLDLKLDERGNLATDNHCMTSRKGVFAAGDARRGQSLVVWAISEGRETRPPGGSVSDGKK